MPYNIHSLFTLIQEFFAHILHGRVKEELEPDVSDVTSSPDKEEDKANKEHLMNRDLRPIKSPN